MPRKRRPARFSVVAAVKENARRQVGQPKPARVLPEKSASKPRHKQTLARTLSLPEEAAGDQSSR